MEKTLLIYMLVGALIGVVFYFTMGQSFIGKIYGAIILGIIGSITGGLLLRDPVKWIRDFFHDHFQIEILAVILGSILLIWVSYLLSGKIQGKH